MIIKKKSIKTHMHKSIKFTGNCKNTYAQSITYIRTYWKLTFYALVWRPEVYFPKYYELYISSICKSHVTNKFEPTSKLLSITATITNSDQILESISNISMLFNSIFIHHHILIPSCQLYCLNKIRKTNPPFTVFQPSYQP